MSSRIKPDWDKLFAFTDEGERTKHEADMLSLKIALQITNYMEERGLSKKELASIIGTSPAYITQILRGDKRINMVFLAKLVKKLNVNCNFKFEAIQESDADMLTDVFKLAKELHKPSEKVIDIRENYIKFAVGSR
jgi:transcriptional regulator with XRE-family HTH domain